MAIHAFSLGEGKVATGMALQTGMGLLAVGLALAVVGTGGPLNALRSPRAGGRLARRLLPVVVVGPVVLGWIATRGMQATTFDPALWTAALSIAMCTLLVAVVWSYAGRLNEEDARREEAQAALERTNAGLATTVAERTESLVQANASLDSSPTPCHTTCAPRSAPSPLKGGCSNSTTATSSTPTRSSAFSAWRRRP